MLYLYGFDDLNDKNGGLTDEAKQILTVFIGLMFGSQAAVSGLKELLAMAAKGVPTQLAKVAITKTTIYQLSKQVAKFIGVKLSKDTFLKGVGKLIPLVGAPISGTLTYFTFKPMAMKLKKYLSGNEFDVIYKHFFCGLTINDIALIKGVSRQAVNQVKARAIKKLSGVFEKD